MSTPIPCERPGAGQVIGQMHAVCGWPWAFHFPAFRTAMLSIHHQEGSMTEQTEQSSTTYQLPPCPPLGTILVNKHGVVLVVIEDERLIRAGGVEIFTWHYVFVDTPLRVVGHTNA